MTSASVLADSAQPGDPGVKDYQEIARLGAPSSPEAVSELLIEFKPGTDIGAFAARWGLTLQRVLRSDPNLAVLKAPSAAAAQEGLHWLRGDRTVQAAYFNHLSQNRPRAFVPNDPYFSPGNPPGFPGQWHLVNPVRPDMDSNVRGAWNRDLTGAGVTIGIADDGVETAHPDLAPNYVAGDSWNFVEQNGDPNPRRADDNHGTSVAGVAAARGGNGMGVTGAAPLASLAGLRVPLGGGGRLSDFVDVIKFHSFGPIRSIQVKNHSYGVSVPFVASEGERDAVAGSAAAGTLHVWAAGNERGKAKEDANKDPVNSSPHVISVAALASSGVFSDYSCFGANVFVTAPSNSRRQGEHGQPGAWTGIATTDRTGDAGYNPGPPDFGVNSFADRTYTGDFGGTSSAAPLVTGILALGVQANPALDVRLAKHVLARTSRVVDPNDSSPTSDGGWKTNAAGFRFNPNYGFGLIDADAFTRQAVQFSGVSPIEMASHNQPVMVSAAIPDRGELSRTFTVDATTPLEEVEIYLRIQHTFRGDLEAVLRSPSGTTSRLFTRNGLADRANQGSVDWWFVANAFWGENPAGTWTLTVRDVFEGDTGTWHSFQARLRMGQPIPATTPTPPTITGFAPASAGAGATVTVTGTKFTDTTAVTFGGVPANFTVLSAAQLTATVPPAAVSGPIRVTTPGGTAASVQAFEVSVGPAITGFNPTSGSSGTSVRITGTRFTGATAVTFNGISAPFTVTSANEITATVPAQATTGRVSVTTPSGTATSSGNFTVSTAPAIGSLTPDSGGPGSSVTLLGANFLGATAVRFNGVAATFTLESATRILAIVPAGATTGPVTVTTPQGTATSSTIFTVPPPPRIDAFTPTTGPAGTRVVIDGAHFLNASAVLFDTIPAAAFNLESDSRILATSPAAATTGPLRVVTPSGAAVSTASFTAVSGPANDAFAASQLLTGDAGSVTGSNVGASRESDEPAHAGNPGGRSVWYSWQPPHLGTWSFDTLGSTLDTVLAVYRGDTLATLIEVAANDDAAGGTNSSLVFTVQAGALYRIAVDGFNPDPTNPAQADAGPIRLNWTPIAAPPVINSFNPIRGTPGTIVTLDGSGFVGTASVEFGGVSATTFNVLSPQRLAATVPSGAVTGPIRVATPAGSATSAQTFVLETGPPNDLFANAQLLLGNSGSVTGSNAGATQEPGEPLHAAQPGGRSVWYGWTAPAAGTWAFDSAGSRFDTLLAVYTGPGVEALTLVAENDDSPDLPNRNSRVTFAAIAGTRYHLALDGYVGLAGDLVLNWQPAPNAPSIARFTPASGAPGTTVVITGIHLAEVQSVWFNQAPAVFTVNSPTQLTAVVPPDATTGPVRVSTPHGNASSAEAFLLIAGPPNDVFAAAQVLQGAAVVVRGGNAGASREANEPVHAGAPGGRSVWYSWTAPATGRWTLDTFGSRFDTTLAVYTGATLTTLTPVASNDDAPGLLTSQVHLNANAGTAYRLAVDGYDGDSGNLILRLMPAAPSQTVFATGFEPHEGYSPLFTLAGQQGWTSEGSGGNGLVAQAFAGLGQQAYIGFAPPLFFGDALYVWRPLNHIPDLAVSPVVRFSVLLMIVDSSNFAYDDFEWQFYNRAGQRLFSLNFDNSDLGVYHRAPGSPSYTWTGVDFENDILHELQVIMDFSANRWSAFLDDQPLAEHVPLSSPGLSLDLGEINAVWIPRNNFFAGDNFMLFDNYQVVAQGSQAPSILLHPLRQTARPGAETAFSVAARGAEPLSYQWRFNGADLPGATDPVLHLANLATSQAGDYSVVVQNLFGSIESQAASLTMFQLLPLHLTGEFSQPEGRFTLTLTGTEGIQVAIETSTDATAWIPFGTYTLPRDALQVVDPNTPRAHQLYRARQIQ